MRLFFIGGGAVGGSMALAFHNAGHDVVGISDLKPKRAQTVARRVRAQAVGASLPDELGSVDVIFVAVPDPKISEIASAVSKSTLPDESQVWLHLSGAFGAEVLGEIAAITRGVGSFHPALVFAPGIITKVPSETVFAVDGNCKEVWDVAQTLSRSICGKIVNVKSEHRALYHASLVFASNYLAGLLSEARTLLVETGLSEQEAEEIAVSLAQSAVGRAVSEGIDGSLSGPIQRGNWETVERHLGALDKYADEREIYLTLGQATLRLVRRIGGLKPTDLALLEQALK